jgi:Leucine-rich repeat (LRR) protein
MGAVWSSFSSNKYIKFFFLEVIIKMEISNIESWIKEMEIVNKISINIDITYDNHSLIQLSLSTTKDIPIRTEIYEKYYSILKQNKFNRFKFIGNFKSIIPNLDLMQNMRILIIDETQINQIDDGFQFCTSIESLFCSNNVLFHIPKWLEKLPNLKSIILINNPNISIHNLYGLKNLINLEIRKNKITFIPKEIKKLEKLRRLDLSNNLITEIPNEIGEMDELQHLILGSNRIQTIPLSIFELPSLELLSLLFNPLSNECLDICRDNNKHGLKKNLKILYSAPFFPRNSNKS